MKTDLLKTDVAPLIPAIPKLTKSEAQKLDAEIIADGQDFLTKTEPKALEMKERYGWEALGFKSWTDYCKSVDEQVTKWYMMRSATKALVERNRGGTAGTEPVHQRNRGLSQRQSSIPMTYEIHTR
jgi:hypothetical protein